MLAVFVTYYGKKYMKLPITKIKPNPDNPRLIKDDKFKSLVKSIKDFPEMADVREIVVNEDYMILGGNMRFKAMQEAGWKEVPVRVVDWSEDKQREFIIKDNVAGGEWDWDVLANEWDKAQLEDWGMDVDKWGYDFEGENKEVDTEKLEEGLDTECPRCHFKFKKDV